MEWVGSCIAHGQVNCIAHGQINSWHLVISPGHHKVLIECIPECSAKSNSWASPYVAQKKQQEQRKLGQTSHLDFVIKKIRVTCQIDF